MSELWSPVLRDLEPYVPGEQPRDRRYIKLNTNENPYPPSPRALDAIRAAAGDDLRLYPDPDGTLLRKAVAKYYSVGEEEVFVGNGSDEILALSFLSFFQRDLPLLFPDVTYTFYEVYCRFFGIRGEAVPLDENFSLRPGDYFRANGGIVFPNPNAPTGRLLDVGEVRRILQRGGSSVVLVDEAYIDFGGRTAIPLVREHPNLLVVQTFSKSRSLAGLRVGFAVGSRDLVAGLQRAKNSFNSYPLDRLALAGAAAALEDEEYFQEVRGRVIATRERVVPILEGLGFITVPSHANFLLLRHRRREGAEIASLLRREGILVRHFDRPRIKDYLRVTVGTDGEMDLFAETSARLLGA